MAYEKITKYTEKFKNDKIGEWSKQPVDADGRSEHPHIMPYMNYSLNVNNFISDVYEFVEEHQEINFKEYRKELKKRHVDTFEKIFKRISDLNCDDILLCIYDIIRGDRFCEGLLYNVFKSGIILKLLNKLKEKDK